MATLFSIFGITLLGSLLPVIAKDIPVPDSNPNLTPSPPSPKQSDELAFRHYQVQQPRFLRILLLLVQHVG